VTNLEGKKEEICYCDSTGTRKPRICTTFNLREVSRLGEWAEEPRGKVVQLETKMPWQRAILQTGPTGENKKKKS